jgi:hypothetical protein
VNAIVDAASAGKGLQSKQEAINVLKSYRVVV